jgi:hypothetical protein
VTVLFIAVATPFALLALGIVVGKCLKHHGGDK